MLQQLRLSCCQFFIKMNIPNQPSLPVLQKFFFFFLVTFIPDSGSFCIILYIYFVMEEEYS